MYEYCNAPGAKNATKKTKATMIIMEECTHAPTHSCKIRMKCFIVYFLQFFLKKPLMYS